MDFFTKPMDDGVVDNPQMEGCDLSQCALLLFYALGSSLLPTDPIVHLIEGLNKSFTKTVNISDRHTDGMISEFPVSDIVHIELFVMHMLVFNASVHDWCMFQSKQPNSLIPLQYVFLGRQRWLIQRSLIFYVE